MVKNKIVSMIFYSSDCFYNQSFQSVINGYWYSFRDTSSISNINIATLYKIQVIFVEVKYETFVDYIF